MRPACCRARRPPTSAPTSGSWCAASASPPCRWSSTYHRSCAELSVTYRSPPRSATTPCSPWTAAVSWWRAARTSARGATSPPPCSSASTGASYLALRSGITVYYLSPQRADRALVPAGHGPWPRRALRRAAPQRPLHPRREGGGRGAGHRVQARGQDMICPSVMSVYHVISQVK